MKASHLSVTHVRYTQKNFKKFLHFQKNESILQSKTSREKMNPALMSNNTWTYPKLGLLISE